MVANVRRVGHAASQCPLDVGAVPGAHEDAWGAHGRGQPHIERLVCRSACRIMPGRGLRHSHTERYAATSASG